MVLPVPGPVKLLTEVEPNQTSVALARSVPVNTTGVPPACGPDCGETDVTVGTKRMSG